MESTQQDTWPVLVHTWWMSIVDTDDLENLVTRLITGLSTVPNTPGAFAVPRPGELWWADTEGVRTGPGPTLLDSGFATATTDPAVPRTPSIVELSLTQVEALAPAIAERATAVGARTVLLAGYVNASGDDAWLGCVVDIGHPRLGVIAGALTQARDIAAAADRRLTEQRRYANRQIEDAILSEASLRMSSSLDIAETLRAVVRMVVPALADAAAIHIDRDGRPADIAVAHIDARRECQLTEYLRGGHWAGAALLRDRDPQYDSTIQQPALPQSAGLPADANLDTMTVTVLRARGRDLGLLTLFHRHAPVRQTAPSFLRNLATRAALAADNAALYGQQRRDVVSLQQHLLPASLPRLPGIDSACAYQVAENTLDVGGDFYDVITQPSGAVTALIGDVCGRGAAAAALTGLARHTMATLLTEGHSVDDAVDALNMKMLPRTITRFLTLAAVTFTPGESVGDRIVRVITAGHPAPFIVRREGTIEQPVSSGLLVGFRPALDLRPAAVRLRPGDILILYTDGLTEARDLAGGFFEDELPDTLLRLRELPLGALADALTAGENRYRVHDDAAVLLFRLTGTTVVDATIATGDIDTGIRAALRHLWPTGASVDPPTRVPAFVGRCREHGLGELHLTIVGDDRWARIEITPAATVNIEPIWAELTR